MLMDANPKRASTMRDTSQNDKEIHCRISFEVTVVRVANRYRANVKNRASRVPDAVYLE